MRTIASELFNFQDAYLRLAFPGESESEAAMYAIWTIWTAVRERLARYRRAVAQPWRMSGDRVGFGNRR
jgi:hypothetical protein